MIINQQTINKIENNKSLPDDLKMALLSVLPFKMNYCNAFMNLINLWIIQPFLF